MYEKVFTILSIIIICAILVIDFIDDTKHNGGWYDVKEIPKIVITIAIQIVPIVISTTWLSYNYVFSSPLDYEDLKRYEISVNYDEKMIVPMPSNVEDTVLLFFHRKEYLRKYGEIISPLKEYKPSENKNWNKEGGKENVTIFNSSRESGLQQDKKR